MSDFSFLYSISEFFYVICKILILVGSLIIVSKFKTVATWLMVGGSAFSLFFYILVRASRFFMEVNIGSDLAFAMPAIFNILGGVSFLAFTVGLILFGTQTVFNLKKN